MRVAAVGEKLGYDGEASFSRTFKRIIGETPSYYRSRGQRLRGNGSSRALNWVTGSYLFKSEKQPLF